MLQYIGTLIVTVLATAVIALGVSTLSNPHQRAIGAAAICSASQALRTAGQR